MSKLNIGIVGGGIGGVAAAVALNQVGIEATVYERAPQIREAGAGMMLWPNATRVLRDWGLLDYLLERSGSSTHFLVRSSKGRILMNIALGSFDVPALTVRRSDLLAALLSALPPDRIRLGQKLNRLEQSRNKVNVSFESGVTAEHDAVIGADGIRSRVRSELFGQIDPIYRGYTVWRGVARYDGSALVAGANSETWGAGKRFGILNVGPQTFVWYAAVNVPARSESGMGRIGDRVISPHRPVSPSPRPLSPDHLDRHEGRQCELLEAFKGWHEPIIDLIAATPDPEIMKNGAYDLVPLRRWGIGRVTLLGDAAHPCTPNLGQGGGMALEDAAVLAKSLAQATQIERALRCYEKQRRHRTKHIQLRSRLMGKIAQWEGRMIVAGRRMVTRLLPARLFEHNLRRVYSYKV